MGEVYRAKDTRLHRVVAIKILPEHVSNSPKLRDRFEREGRAISISEGRARPESLGIQADGDFALRINLRQPNAYFLKLIGMPHFAPVPRHVVEGSDSSWARPGRMVSSGPFLLHEWRPDDKIVLRRNPCYYNAGCVQLEEILFLPITDGVTSVNLYKTGEAHAMHGRAVPPLWIPALRGRKDFHTTPALRSLFYAFNTTKPPFDNRLARNAFNLATDKDEIVRFLGGGQRRAHGVIPPFAGYEGIRTLPIMAGGRSYDVLSHDPAAARELLGLAGISKLAFDLTFPNRPRSKEIAEILQQQWRTTLNAEVKLFAKDWNAWIRTALSLDYNGVIESGVGADYADPNTFFEFFTGRADGSGWNDSEFNRMIDAANAIADPVSRMEKLAACEEHLFRAMPVLPLFFDSYSYLQKPYVRGMTPNSLDVPQFRSTWIDTNWRLQ
jgi:oligopeptide transport system substrate-binding protein